MIYVYQYIYIYIYRYIYVSAWLHPSLPPLMKGWFDHMEADYWSFGPHRPPKIMMFRMVTNGCQFRNKS